MVSQKLKLNADKTELLVVYPKSRRKLAAVIQMHIENSTDVQLSSVRNLSLL